MGNAVVVFAFPEPESPVGLALILETSKQLFKDIPGVTIHMAVGDAAETVKFFLQEGELPTEVPRELSDSNLVRHAKRELELLGEDSDFIAGYLKMIQAFADMGHSGGSASVFVPTLNELLQLKNLTPLTNDPDEWLHHEEGIAGQNDLWQSIRNPEAFSNDGGETYHLMSEGVDGRFPNYETKKVK